MNTLNDDNAIEVALEYLKSKGIETIKVMSVRRIQGDIRNAYIHEKSDYWIITFERSTRLLAPTDGLGEEESEILRAFSTQNDLVSVAVEKDGSAAVV